MRFGAVEAIASLLKQKFTSTTVRKFRSSHGISERNRAKSVFAVPRFSIRANSWAQGQTKPQSSFAAGVAVVFGLIALNRQAHSPEKFDVPRVVAQRF